jgi:ornithine cyclodeaminase
MGADLPEKRELMPGVLPKADIVACDVRSQTFTVGELYNATQDNTAVTEPRVLELGEIISGKVNGRQSRDQITICDLSGTGVQDTAIADYAMTQAAVTHGIGTQIPM